MEYSENGDIEHEIDLRRLKRDYWREADILKHITELIDAFTCLQDCNMTHGDVKPRNLFIAADGRLKIGDFGESN